MEAVAGVVLEPVETCFNPLTRHLARVNTPRGRIERDLDEEVEQQRVLRLRLRWDLKGRGHLGKGKGVQGARVEGAVELDEAREGEERCLEAVENRKAEEVREFPEIPMKVQLQQLLPLWDHQFIRQA